MLKVIFAPLRFVVFILLGAFVVFGLNNCVPEQGDINPPQSVQRTY